MTISPAQEPERATTRAPATRTWVPVLLVGLVLFETTRRAALVTGNPQLLLAMVLFGTLIVPVTFLTMVWGRHLQHDVTPVMAMVVATARPTTTAGLPDPPATGAWNFVRRLDVGSPETTTSMVV